MTTFTNTRPQKMDVIGPYSPWPRQKPKTGRKVAAVVASVGGVGVFVHCAVPMLMAV